MSHYDLPILVLPALAFGLLAIVFWLLCRSSRHNGYKRALQASREEYRKEQEALISCYTDGLEQEIERLSEEIHTLDSDVERYINDSAAYKKQVEVLVNTNNELRVEVALLKDMIRLATDDKDMVKTHATQPLDNATVQMPEVETQEPIPTPRAKRTARKDVKTKVEE